MVIVKGLIIARPIESKRLGLSRTLKGAFLERTPTTLILSLLPVWEAFNDETIHLCKFCSGLAVLSNNWGWTCRVPKQTWILRSPARSSVPWTGFGSGWARARARWRGSSKRWSRLRCFCLKCFSFSHHDFRTPAKLKSFFWDEPSLMAALSGKTITDSDTNDTKV